jgi:hypothetical protein
MSKKHPVIAVTGSSGAGTTTVKHAFGDIFRRASIKAAVVEGDSFHRYNRAEMKDAIKEFATKGKNCSAPMAKAAVARHVCICTTKTRPLRTNSSPAPSRRGHRSRRVPICCFTRGCTAAPPMARWMSPSGWIYWSAWCLL